MIMIGVATPTVLITGANGFVGRALCQRMLAEGWLARGTVRSVEQAASLPAGAEAVMIRSIGPATDWTAALAGIDTIVHLAARVHVMRDTATDPLAEFRLVNVAGTEHLARVAASAGVKRFVYLSSVKVNGEGALAPYTELDAPAPMDPYGVSKWEAEQVLQKIAKETGLEVVILRPPLVYGPGVKANFLRLFEVVAHGIPLPLASVNNRRSLIYLKNLVDAIVTCGVSQAAGQTYLVSDGVDVSTPDLIRQVAASLEKPPRLFPFPPFLITLAGELTGKSAGVDRLIGSFTVDCSKIRRELAWVPPYTLIGGLVETAQWFMGQNTRK